MASVTYDRVAKYFDGLKALDDFSLKINDQEFMVLVGPSGSGKSTALRLLAGIETPTSGDILIDGEIVNDVSPRDRDVAMVFQSYALYPYMSVYDNLGFGLRVRGTPKAEIDRAVKQAARALGIEELLKRRPGQLSGGQRQRVALGRALVRRPKAFLLDEPLSNLDATLRAQTRIEILRLHRQVAGTFVYVTHDQAEAMTMGDRIAVLKSGTIQQVASPGPLYSHPANVYVAGFFGSPRINLVSVTIEGRCARASGFRFDLPWSPAVERAIVGLRPEAFAPAEQDSAVLVLKAELIDMLGADQFVYGRVGEDQLTVRVPPSLRVAPGDLVRLRLDPEQAHLFDVRTERAITPGS